MNPSPRSPSATGITPPIATRHTGPNGRVFTRHASTPCYDVSENLPGNILPSAARARLLSESESHSRTLLSRHPIAARSGAAFRVPRHALLRLSVPSGPQVADLNVWNAADPSEHFYSGKTRQLHAAHLTAGDSLWSTMPDVRPLATLTADSVCYGRDADGAGVHDVIGTRCDPYTRRRLAQSGAEHDGSGQVDTEPSCHGNLVKAVKPLGLREDDVHDVFNAFMCTGFDSHGRYFTKPSPVRTGDFIELFAHLELIVAVSACPQGDVSVPCGDRDGRVPECYPLLAEIFQAPPEVVALLDV